MVQIATLFFVVTGHIKKEGIMKHNVVMLICMVILGLSYSGIHCSQEPSDAGLSIVADVKQDSLDEFDQLVDDAMHDDVFKNRAPIQEPTGMRLFFMRLGVPLVCLYTSAVVKYRVFKAWFKQHCVDPVVQTVGSHVHFHRYSDASETTNKK